MSSAQDFVFYDVRDIRPLIYDDHHLREPLACNEKVICEYCAAEVISGVLLT